MTEKTNTLESKTVNYWVRFKRLCQLFWWVVTQLRVFGKNFETDPSPHKTFKKQEAALSFLKILDAKVNIQGRENFVFSKNLVVANHASWLDIFALLSIYPMSFIAKREIKKWPFLGRIITNAGTVYINRNNKKESIKISQSISEELDKDQIVAFFPEAKIVDGKTLQPFKAALFQAALESDSTTQPICINYFNNNGEPSNVPIYDDSVNLFQSLWHVVSANKLNIQVVITPGLQVNKDTTRFELAEQSKIAIANHFNER